jgi:cation transporter-like permease
MLWCGLWRGCTNFRKKKWFIETRRVTLSLALQFYFALPFVVCLVTACCYFQFWSLILLFLLTLLLLQPVLILLTYLIIYLLTYLLNYLLTYLFNYLPT